MKDYYQILTVSRTASEVEIKRAFRKLAVIYHPDKNPDPAAEQFFKEVNEAYDVLGNPEKRRAYDFRLVNAFVQDIQTQPPKAHRDPAYRRRRPAGPRPKTEQQKLFELMVLYAPVCRKIILVAFYISVFLIIDFALPRTTSYEMVIDTSGYNKGSDEWMTVRTHKRALVIPFQWPKQFTNGTRVSVKSSLFLNIPTRLESETASAKVYKTIYSNFIFIPIALILSSWLGMRFRRQPEKAFNYAIVSLMALGLTVMLFLSLQ